MFEVFENIEVTLIFLLWFLLHLLVFESFEVERTQNGCTELVIIIENLMLLEEESSQVAEES